MGSVCVAPLLPPQQTPSPGADGRGQRALRRGSYLGKELGRCSRSPLWPAPRGRGSPGDGGDTKGRSDGTQPARGPLSPLVPSSRAEMLVVVPADRQHWGLLVATGHGRLWGRAGQVALKAHLSDDVFIY